MSIFHRPSSQISWSFWVFSRGLPSWTIGAMPIVDFLCERPVLPFSLRCPCWRAGCNNYIRCNSKGQVMDHRHLFFQTAHRFVIYGGCPYKKESIRILIVRIIYQSPITKKRHFKNQKKSSLERREEIISPRSLTFICQWSKIQNRFFIPGRF